MKSNRQFFVYVIITAITAWFSVGFYQVDEHFQILEPGAWKSGWISQQDLPWEFFSAMRSSVEPTIIFLLIKGLSILKTENPFTVTLLFRLISAALSIICFTLWRNHVKRSADSSALLIWYDAALLLWFIPYMSVRFSLEIWGGCLFFISLALVYGKNESASRNFLIAGCVAALAFFIRFQTGLLIAGFLFFKVLHLKKNFRNLLWYGAGFILATAVNVFLDHWFYQKWCFTPWNYFLENIIHKHAAEFGHEPFYDYFFKVFKNAFPLQGILIIATFFIYLVRKFRDEVSMGVLFFLIGHLIIGHKEMRFIFPLIFILPFVFAHSMHWVSQFNFTKTIFYRVLMILTVVINLIMLVAVTVRPSDSQVSMQRALYNLIGHRPAAVFYEGENPFSRVGLTMNFYKNRNMKLLPVDSLSQYAEQTSEKILLVTNSSSVPEKYPGNFRCVYQDIPQWILKLNYHDWVSKIKIIRVYEKQQ
ncbi:MAG TPA: hypothetical protein VE978_23740 [Chitinophagales bacterium]|nr:hypothetical protein [Chitinophagales bacterium]